MEFSTKRNKMPTDKDSDLSTVALTFTSLGQDEKYNTNDKEYSSTKTLVPESHKIPNIFTKEKVINI